MKEKTAKGRVILSVFNEMSKWEPEHVKVLTDEIWDKIVEASGVSEENLRKAMDMVAEEGFNGGPAYHEEYPEHFEANFSFNDALSYVRAAMKAKIEDVKWLNPDYEFESSDNEDESADYVPPPNSVISSESIMKNIFGWYFQIYYT